jgi:hypothetical protein
MLTWRARAVLQTKKDEWWASLTHGLADGVRFYAGHTRFATSSIVRAAPLEHTQTLYVCMYCIACSHELHAHVGLIVCVYVRICMCILHLGVRVLCVCVFMHL